MNQKISNQLKALSFWAILMVLVIHANNHKLIVGLSNVATVNNVNYFVQSFFSQGIAAVAVPIFFGISGYLFFFSFTPTTKGYISKVTKRFRTLFIPYLFWSMLGFLLLLILQSLPLLKNFFNQKLISNLSLLNFFDTILLHPIPYQFWFVLHLWVLILCVPFIQLALHYLGGLFIAITTVVWFFNFNLPYLQSESFLFFTIGAYFGKHKIQTYNSLKTRYTCLLTISWLVLVTFKTMLVGSSFSPHLMVGLLHKISVLVGIITCWLLLDELAKFKNINQYKWFAVTPYTFFIFATHEPLLTVIKKLLLVGLMPNNWLPLIVYFAAPVISLGLALSMGYFIKKQFPVLYNWITGGR